MIRKFENLILTGLRRVDADLQMPMVPMNLPVTYWLGWKAVSKLNELFPSLGSLGSFRRGRGTPKANPRGRLNLRGQQ